MISAPTHGTFLNSVGKGLKVNRPKAERGHPGVCPSHRISVGRGLLDAPHHVLTFSAHFLNLTKEQFLHGTF